VFSLEIVANGLLRGLETASTRTFREDVTYDAALLLGGGVDVRATADSGSPAYRGGIERRLVTHDLLRRGRARFAIISAAPADRTAGVAEAQVLADQLVAP